ncbi:DUF5819 family protein [Catellatospora paridis]|uniref:DUF5819 family protein n=1 Tax=Catellatospora paridis TaxID=1617086 RepID=UPI001E3A90D8|nr:DUF5819 family protein [Catellatospora paridis]
MEERVRGMRWWKLNTRREGTEPRLVDRASNDGAQHVEPPQLVRAAMGVAVALCVMTSLVHVLLVFLYVTPSNEISRRYDSQINAWIYPFFEQNWKLFAPDPETATSQISVRTTHTSTDGSIEVSDWFDLTAVDEFAVKHNVFPSHTTQNLLRRAWITYLDTHGNDDEPHSERALMMQKYLRNIAVGRLTAHRPAPFEAIQLRVITRPIMPRADVGQPRPAAPPADVRELPWWTVTSDGN